MKKDKKRINLEETAAALRQQYPGVNIVAQSNNEYVVYSDDVINGGDIIDITPDTDDSILQQSITSPSLLDLVNHLRDIAKSNSNNN